MAKWRGIAAVTCLVLAAVVLAACGSSNKSSSSTSASTGASTSASTSTPASTGTSTGASTGTSATAPTGAAFKIGMVCSCSGAQAAVFGGDDGVGKAWASSVNAAGGINGHPVQLIVKDDASNPATSLQAVKALVEQDHVQAISPDMSLVDATWASYVAAKGIPVVGGIASEVTFLTNPDFYPSGTQLLVNTVGVALVAKSVGATHLGVVYCAESPICAQLDPLAKGAATLAGLKYTSLKISATAPNYTAPCLALKSAGVDALYVADNSPVVVRFVDACAQQGFKPKGAYNIGGLSNLVLADKNMEGAVMAAENANPFDASTPAIKTFQDALNKYDPGFVNSPKFGFPTILVWAGAQLFKAAAEQGHLTPSSTPAEVKQALYKLHNETLTGVAPPLTFTPGKPAFVDCYFTEKISGGKFTSLNKNQPSCLNAAQAKALAALAG